MIEYLLSTFKKNCWLVGATVCMALAYSCEDETVVSRPQMSNDEIAFSIASDSTWQAPDKAASRSVTKKNAQFLAAVGEDSLYIQMVEEENNTPIFAAKEDSTDSRGASLSTGLTNFKLTAFLDVNDVYSEYMMNQEVTRNTSTGECTYSPIKYWPHDQKQKIHFFGYAQSIGTLAISPTFTVTSGDPETYTGTFSYALPAPDATNKDDATRQPDLIFAIAREKNKTSGTVELNFQHALSAVVFQIKNVPSGVTINSISLKQVKSSGNCNLSGNDSGITFTWTPNDALNDYVQTFNRVVLESANAQKISDESNEECFMMIPHQFTENALLQIDITRTVGSQTFDDIVLVKKLKDLSTSWEPNKKYTYIISLPDEVKVHVDDEVDEATEKIKSDLVIKNTGLSPIYVRAAIIGNWVTEHIKNGETTYNVVADWRNTGTPANDDGVFEWGTGGEPQTNANVRNWRKGSDGFYYYMKEIAPGQVVPDKLFETYTLTANSPVPEAVLDLTIAVQALRYEDIITSIGEDGGNDVYIWSSEIVTILKTPNP